MPAAAAVVAIAAPFVAETVGAYVISTIAAEAVVSSVVATAVGSAVISGGVTALRGGSASDVLRSAVTSGIASGAGAYIGNVVGTEVASTTDSVIAGKIAANVAKASTTAAVLGKDAGKAAFVGLAQSVPLMLSQFDSFNELPDFAKNTIASGTAAAITGGDVKTAVLSSALQSANVMGQLINSNDSTREFFSDPKNKQAVALMQNGITYGISAAVQGRDVGQALGQALVRTTGQLIGSEAGKQLAEYTNQAREKYAAAQQSENALRDNIVQQQAAVEKFNAATEDIRAMSANRDALEADYNAQYAKWKRLSDNGDISAANAQVANVNAAVAKLNDSTKALNTYYDEHKDVIEPLKQSLDSLKTDYAKLETDYNAKAEDATNASKTLEQQNVAFQTEAEKQLKETVDPFETTPDEAAKIFAKYRGLEVPDELQKDTTWTPEEQVNRAAAQFELAKMSSDPEYYKNFETGYNFAISQGKSDADAQQFATDYAGYKTGREAIPAQTPAEFKLDVGDANFADSSAVAPPGTRLATREEVETALRADDPSVYYDAASNAYVKVLATELPTDLASAKQLTIDQIGDYQGADGVYRIPNPDGSYHAYNANGVYQGLYGSDDQLVQFDPNAAPFTVAGAAERELESIPMGDSETPAQFAGVPASFVRASVISPTQQVASAPTQFKSPAQVSPSPRDATIAPTASTTQQAAASSTLGNIPGSWMGGLGREVRFIDPLEASQAGTPEVIDMIQPSPLQSLSEQQSQLQANYWNPQPQSTYYSYGTEPTYASVVNAMGTSGTPVRTFKNGGNVMASPLMAAKGGDVEHKGSHYVQGAGGGQDDLIDAKLADGEYVFDAEIVSALGDGSNKRGAEILDKWREQIRKHKRSASIKGIPPKAKSPLAYLREIK